MIKINVIEKTKEIILAFPKMAEFCKEFSIDYNENNIKNCGLFSVGDEIVKEDILGNQDRTHQFILFSVNASYTDYDRLLNSGFLLELSYYLNKQKEIEIDSGYIKSISTANGMMYEIPTGNINDGIAYQLQIYTKYKIESEI
ncbi:MAG: hypothetical protein RR436_07090 [Clostridia bacterium]